MAREYKPTVSGKRYKKTAPNQIEVGKQDIGNMYSIHQAAEKHIILCCKDAYLIMTLKNRNSSSFSRW